MSRSEGRRRPERPKAGAACPRPPTRRHATIRNKFRRLLCNPASLQVVEGKGFVGDPPRIPANFAHATRQIAADRGGRRNLGATASGPLASPVLPDRSSKRSGPQATLAALAAPHRYRARLDAEGWPVIPGKLGRLEWHDGDRLAVYSRPAPRVRPP